MKSIIQGNTLKFMHPAMGYQGKAPGTVKQITHDGDTIKVYEAGNLSLRFLGIDTPEISFEIKGNRGFISTGNSKWADYLNAIESHWPTIETDLGAPLFGHITSKLAPGNAAQNHYTYARIAESTLEAIIAQDMIDFELTNETIRFFVPFAYEIMDGYGRLLSFVNTYVADETKRKADYNFRVLESGASLPYFIWPNINPFRKQASLVDAVFANPAQFRKALQSDRSLQLARQVVKQARDQQKGVFHAQDPLLLEAFELRYLGRQSAPSRWFIDITAQDNGLRQPATYFMHLPEDRLFIPEHFVPLFESKGWVKQQEAD